MKRQTELEELQKAYDMLIEENNRLRSVLEMKTKKPIKRKVVCVFGEWGKDTDFVLEPVDEGLDKKGYYNKKRWLGRSFWIQECEGKHNSGRSGITGENPHHVNRLATVPDNKSLRKEKRRKK